ncbi:hypothetical protein BC567DRAFT_227738 [Phyllosticta citribraziliensis]
MLQLLAPSARRRRAAPNCPFVSLSLRLPRSRPCRMERLVHPADGFAHHPPVVVVDVDHRPCVDDALHPCIPADVPGLHLGPPMSTRRHVQRSRHCRRGPNLGSSCLFAHAGQERCSYLAGRPWLTAHAKCVLLASTRPTSPTEGGRATSTRSQFQSKGERLAGRACGEWRTQGRGGLSSTKRRVYAELRLLLSRRVTNLVDRQTEPASSVRAP